MQQFMVPLVENGPWPGSIQVDSQDLHSSIRKHLCCKKPEQVLCELCISIYEHTGKPC